MLQILQTNKMDSKNINNIIAVLAILAVAVAVINLCITFTKEYKDSDKISKILKEHKINVILYGVDGHGRTVFRFERVK